MTPTWYQWQNDRLILHLRVQPRSSRNAFGEPLDGRLRIYLTAPPVNGKANAALIAWLADVFSVAKRDVLIRRGKSGRSKEVVISAPKHLPEFISRR